MASGPFFGFSPLAMLQQRVVDREGMPTGPTNPPAPQAPVAPPSGAPPAAAAPSPAAPTDAGPSVPSGGGASGAMGGIGTAISNAFSGAGLFGQGAGDMGEADPVTGVTPGDKYRANMQSFMKMGMMLIAAGSRQSDDSRARILAALPSALENGANDINSFAKNRLEMAKLKLLQREQQQKEEQGAAIMQYYGLGGAGGVAAPGGAGTPASAGAVPGPGNVTAAPLAAPADPNLGNVPPAAPPPAADPTIPPNYAPNLDVNTIGTQKPPPPAVPKWQPGPADMPFLATAKGNPAKVAEYAAERENERRKMEMATPLYRDPNVGIVYDVYVDGKFKETKKLSDLNKQVTTRPGDATGQTIVETKDDAGRVVDRKIENDPTAQTALNEDRGFVRDAFKEQDKLYWDTVKPSVRSYDKLTDLEGKLRQGKAITGTAADMRRQGLNFLASMGWLRKDRIDALINSSDVERQLATEAGQFAKQNYGPNVSNFDVEHANKIMGALMSNDKSIIANTLRQVRNERRSAIERYNERADAHNARAGRMKMQDAYALPRVDKSFDGDDEKLDALQPEGEAAPTGPAPVSPVAPPAAPAARFEFDPANPATFAAPVNAAKNAVKAAPEGQRAALRAALRERLEKAGIPASALEGI